MHIKKIGRVAAGFTRVGRVSLRPGPVPCPGQPAGPVRVSKLW